MAIECVACSFRSAPAHRKSPGPVCGIGKRVLMNRGSRSRDAWGLATSEAGGGARQYHAATCRVSGRARTAHKTSPPHVVGPVDRNLPSVSCRYFATKRVSINTTGARIKGEFSLNRYPGRMSLLQFYQRM